jgi:hypothetical protein
MDRCEKVKALVAELSQKQDGDASSCVLPQICTRMHRCSSRLYFFGSEILKRMALLSYLRHLTQLWSRVDGSYSIQNNEYIRSESRHNGGMESPCIDLVLTNCYEMKHCVQSGPTTTQFVS